MYGKSVAQEIHQKVRKYRLPGLRVSKIAEKMSHNESSIRYVLKILTYLERNPIYRVPTAGGD